MTDLLAMLIIGPLLLVLIVLSVLNYRRQATSTVDYSEVEALRNVNSQLDRKLAVERAESTSRARIEAQRISELEDKVWTLETEKERMRDENAILRSDVAALRASLDSERVKAEESLKTLNDFREDMAAHFRDLMKNVIQENGSTISQQSRVEIEAIVTPLREKLQDFQRGLAEVQSESTRERNALSEQIRLLTETSRSMMSETTNLARVIKGEVQDHGAWGEMVLLSLLEKSGLRDGEEYIVRNHRAVHDGESAYSDVVVSLPGAQRIVIDAGLSLTSFEAYVNADSIDERGRELRNHINQMKNRIRALSERSGRSGKGVDAAENDFVIMFVPIEGALAAALKEAPELTTDALKFNVSIATPTTLMIALRSAAAVWSVERRNKNSEDIAEKAGELYDKFVEFIEDMQALGARIDQVQTAHRGAMNKLNFGNSNLIGIAEHLKSIGVKSNRNLKTVVMRGDDTTHGAIGSTEDNTIIFKQPAE